MLCVWMNTMMWYNMISSRLTAHAGSPVDDDPRESTLACVGRQSGALTTFSAVLREAGADVMFALADVLCWIDDIVALFEWCCKWGESNMYSITVLIGVTCCCSQHRWIIEAVAKSISGMIFIFVLIDATCCCSQCEHGSTSMNNWRISKV